MTCLTCQRRKKQCDDHRPRCSTCKASHLRCKYDGPPDKIQFHYEQPGASPSPSGFQTTDQPSLTGPSPSVFTTPHEESPLNFQDPSDEAIFRDVISFWDQSFTHSAPLEDLMLPGLRFDFPAQNKLRSSLEEPDESVLFPVADVGLDMHNQLPISPLESAQQPNSSLNDRPLVDTLPIPLLAQHYSRAVAGRFSSKKPDWTFYTYFFHRFADTHRWVLSSIFAWTSTNLYYSGKVSSLGDASRHYSDCLSRMSEKLGVGVDSMSVDNLQEQDQVTNTLVGFSQDDIDATFVAYFFLALVNLMTARTGPLRDILTFVSQFLHIPNVKSEMTGIRARVISWFCTLDGKASTFQHGGGAVLKAMGDEESLISVLRLSCSTLHQAYSITYPEEELSSDEIQLPLLELMLRLVAMLHYITEAKHSGPDPSQAAQIRTKLDSHLQTLNSLSQIPYPGRSQFTFQVVRTLYHAVEISFSRALKPDDVRHSANAHAVSMILIAQKLKTMQPAASKDLPPPTKIWPLPLVMAAIEVEDIIYREWAVDLLKKHEQVAGEHYTWSRKFTERVCEAEDKEGRRLDWEVIMSEVKDGLVI